MSDDQETVNLTRRSVRRETLPQDEPPPHEPASAARRRPRNAASIVAEGTGRPAHGIIRD